MNIQMIGIDHGKAGVDIRAMFSFTRKAGDEAMSAICAEPGINSCLILSTCNRMEVWANGEEGADLPLFELVCRLKGLDPDEYRQYFVCRQGEAAVRHLFRTTSGLESLILGEDQILTQVKTSLQYCREAECTDSVLETLFRMAVTGAKKVKTGMQRSMTNVSAIEQAIRWMKVRQGMTFEGKKCLVIGNGEMGKRSALAFRAEGADVTVTIRQYRSGVVEIPAGCGRINYGERYELLPDCDIIVSATSSPNLTLKADEVKAVRKEGEQIYIDLAVPRDIDPEIGCLEGTVLYTIDDFSVTESEENARVIRQAEAILEEQIQEFLHWVSGRDLIPMVKEIGGLNAAEAYWRMQPAVKKLHLEAEDEEKLKEAIERAADKVIQKMLFTVRNEAGMDVFRSCLEALEKGMPEDNNR